MIDIDKQLIYPYSTTMKSIPGFGEPRDVYGWTYSLIEPSYNPIYISGPVIHLTDFPRWCAMFRHLGMPATSNGSTYWKNEG